MEQGKIWDVLQTETDSAENFPEARQRYMAARLKPGQDVLNIGVGSGALERLCLKRGVRMHSLDPSAGAIDRLRRDLDMGNRAQAGFAQSMPFADASFDVVVMSEVLEHLDDAVLTVSLAEVRRVLRPGGYLLASTPFAETLRDGRTVCPHCGGQFHRMGHVQSFDRERMSHLLTGQGFVEIRVSVSTFIDWKRPGILKFLKSVLRWTLAKMGETIADPHLIVTAHRPR